MLQNTHVLRLVNLRRDMPHQPYGCSGAIQLSLTHQVSPSRVNLFPFPGIFLADASLKEYVLTTGKPPQNPKPNNSQLSGIGGILLIIEYPPSWMLTQLSHTSFLCYLSADNNPKSPDPSRTRLCTRRPIPGN